MGGLNIAFMHVARKNRGEEAMTILELDEEPLPSVIEAIKGVDGIQQAFSIPAIG
jgi:L-serine dehydratase